MRKAITFALLAAALFASPLALAQRASLADRVSALEQRAATDQGGSLLVNQLTQLRDEVKALRGQVEQLQQQLEQAKQGQRAQYLDLSGRLDRLEAVAPAGAVVAAPTGTGNAQPAAPQDIAKPAQAPASSPAPMASGDEQGAYEHAFEALKAGDYVESARRFREFLIAFPGGQLAPNALYWLGESYYVTQNYELALQQFQGLLERFPTDAKAPGALLKAGLSQYGLRQYEAADATLRQVVQRYPGSSVARTAEDRLRSMQLTGG